VAKDSLFLLDADPLWGGGWMVPLLRSGSV